MGKYFLTDKGLVPVIDDDGNRHWLPQAKAVKAIRAKGWTPDLSDETREKLHLPEQVMGKEKILDAPVTAAAMGALGSATMGLSDVAIRGLGGPEAGLAMQQLREANPMASMTGQVAGFLVPGAPIGWIGRGARAAGAAAQTAIGGAAATGVRGALGRLAGTATRFGLEGGAIGAGTGLSAAVSREQVQDVGQAMVTGAVEGMAYGAGLGVAGLAVGSAARLIGGKVKSLVSPPKSALDISRLHRMEAERVGLMAEKEALKEVRAGLLMAPSEGTAAEASKFARNATQLARIDERLLSVTEKIAESPRATSGIAEWVGSKLTQRIMGAAAGGFAGGPVGAVVGAIVSPMVGRATVKIATPAIEAIGRAGRAVVESPVGRVVGRASFVAPISTKEWGGLVDDLRMMTPEMAGIRAEIDARGAGQEGAADAGVFASNTVGFLQTKLQTVSPPTTTPLGHIQHGDPGVAGRKKMTDYIRGALNPGAIVSELEETGDTSSEALEALGTIHPGVMRQIRSGVEAEIKLRMARGGKYSVADERRMAKILGRKPRILGFGSLAEEGKMQPRAAGQKAPKDAAGKYKTRLQKLADEGIA